LSSGLLKNEAQLIAQVIKGDEKAFGSLFHAYRDKLYSFVLRIAGSREIAEDIVQDVFLKIWTLRDRLAGIDNFNAFLFRMSQNHAINHLRKMARETIALGQAGSWAHAGISGSDDPLTFRDIRHSLREIVATLPPQQKAVYQLSREENLRQDEIARRLHISVSTVKNHMTQALKTIQQGLRQYYPLALIPFVLFAVHGIG
jgi:RNA polymerase sigma-70 factor (ECF subfamily)